MSAAGFSGILAAMAGVRPSLLDPLHYEDVNVRGTLILLEEIRRREGTRMVFASSSSVYGANEDVPFRESEDIHRPVSPYAATKHGITGLTRATSLDGRKYDIACGQIDIGNAETDMTASMKTGRPQAHGGVAVEATFDVEHVAEMVLFMANLPLDTNVQFVTIMATKMPYIGRG